MRSGGVAALALLAAATASSGAPAAVRHHRAASAVPETKSRISADRLARLVREPMRLVQAGRRAEADAVFLKLLAAARARGKAGAVRAADLLTAYGVALYEEGEESDSGGASAAIPWLEQAVTATRSAWGPSHPETALALQNLADVIREVAPEAPGAEAEAALREAYRIRVKALGPGNAETLYTLKSLGDVLSAGPETASPEAGRAAEAAEAYRHVIGARPAARDANAVEVKVIARLALARLLARSGRLSDAVREVKEAEQTALSWRGGSSGRAMVCRAYAIGTWKVADALEANGAADEALKVSTRRDEGRSRCFDSLLP
ncbi:MAG: hypothetical protein QOE79_75 [Sphingomonadales bacterium]|jgi:tetratricopeptide (TPR) repeat protein|nr:hypothetical protein [Sphingomonadales bacterium]